MKGKIILRDLETGKEKELGTMDYPDNYISDSEKYITDRTIGWEVQEVDSIEELLKQKDNEKCLYVERLDYKKIKSDLKDRILKIIDLHYQEENSTLDFFYIQSKILEQSYISLIQNIVRVIDNKQFIVDIINPSQEEVIKLSLYIYDLLLRNSKFIIYSNKKQFRK